MMSFLSKSYKLLIDVISPPFCLFCKDFLHKEQVFCDHCKGFINPIVSTQMYVTKKYPVKVFAISDYKNPVRTLILAKGSRDIVASRKLAELMWDLTYVKNAHFDFIIPVPLHWKRFAARGFNQAEEISHVIAQKSGKEVVNLLKRTKKTRRQSELSPENRFSNVKNAFELTIKNNDDFKDKTFLIVDDLMTTGSTIKAVARKLIALKPKKIVVVVGCRVI